MSFDPMTGPPNRPRSTPIPDPDGRGPSLPPPTAAQFLNEQSSLPWTAQPGPDVNTSFQMSSVGYAAPSAGSSLGRVIALLVVLVSIGGVGFAIYAGTRAGEAAITRIPDLPPIPTFVVPAVATIAAPTVAPPDAVPPATFAASSTVPALAVPTMDELVTTLPTPPPTTGLQPPTAFPGAAATLYDAGAARPIADLLELALAGDPTQLTQVYVFADYAIATAQDPQNPGQLIGAYWRDGEIGDANITSSGGGGDISYQLFTEGEVNWESLAALVPQAAALLNIPDGQVTYVAVQRVGVGNPPPIVIDVYVEGASGKGYVEASAAGDVLSVNNG